MLFHAGDPSDGMYVLRSGELEVFLEQGGKIISLAKVENGGMIGEMALFDNKPRSAAVRATVKSEVTHITLDDFTKLMKQIPKWFTALMQTLSSRLRATNAQLQEITQKVEALEAKAKTSTKKMHDFLQILYISDLVFQKDGKKDGVTLKGAYKSYQVERNLIFDVVKNIFTVEESKLIALFTALGHNQLINSKVENKTTQILFMESRARLAHFCSYLKGFLRDGGIPCLPDPSIDLIKVLDSFSKKSVYDTFTVSLAELKAAGAKMNILSINKWDALLMTTALAHEDLRLVKTPSGEPGYRVRKKEFKDIYIFQSTISQLAKVAW